MICRRCSSRCETSVDIVFDAVVHPNDVYRNAGINAKASKVNQQALDAYHGGDYAKALSLVKQAHEIEPKDTIMLYNLACFNALVGNRDEALDWLQKAVEAGFYATVQDQHGRGPEELAQ